MPWTTARIGEPTGSWVPAAADAPLHAQTPTTDGTLGVAMVTGHDSWSWALLAVPLFVVFLLAVTVIEARARRRPFRVFARQTWTAVRGGPEPPL